jgi:hypothetical protein
MPSAQDSVHVLRSVFVRMLGQHSCHCGFADATGAFGTDPLKMLGYFMTVPRNQNFPARF